MHKQVVGALLGLLTLTALTVGCGDDGTARDAGASGATAAVTTSSATPRRGGVLAFGEFSEPAGLDPIVSTGAGSTGAIEMSAVYDTIMRWNPDAGTYEPRTAQSLTSNPDFTEWTLTLKPGIKFTDGTDYDAAAVMFGLNRHRSGTPDGPPCAEVFACPRNTTSSSVYMALVKNLRVADPLTLQITLNQPWSAFPYALADEAGMIPSPTALKRCDAAQSPRQCDFNVKPVGAGPFIVESFKAKDSITMVRNPNYYGGAPYLDGLRFTNANDAGGPKTYELIKAGTLQGAFLRDPATTKRAHADGLEGLSSMSHTGGMFTLNTGATVSCVGGKPEPACVGRPDGPVTTSPATKNVKVRQAFAAAIDPKVLDQRANDGTGFPSSDLLQSDFRWSPGVSGPAYDPATAKRLVAEAKAEGWDGKIRLLGNSSPSSQALTLATQTMLQAVGMDVTADVSKDVTAGLAQVTIAKDFDVFVTGTALTNDDGSMVSLAQNLASWSGSNRANYKSAAVDQAIRDLFAAPDDAAKKAAFKTIADQLKIDVPILSWSKVEEFNVHTANVHGLVFNHSGSVLFDKAWLDK
jgi:peptide/nickel transport system substrate-binding protein